MTDLRADMKKAVEFGVARFAPIWQRDWEKIMAESRRMTDRELMQQVLELLDYINQCSLPPAGIPLPAEIDHVMEELLDRLEEPDLAAVGEVGVWDERQWQGLTDEEIQQIEMSASSKLSAIYLAEAQLKGENAL